MDADGTIANGVSLYLDWLIEGLSPDRHPRILIRKFFGSPAHGCHVGWIVAPQEQVVFAHWPPGQGQLFTQAEQTPTMPELRHVVWPDATAAVLGAGGWDVPGQCPCPES